MYVFSQVTQSLVIVRCWPHGMHMQSSESPKGMLSINCFQKHLENILFYFIFSFEKTFGPYCIHTQPQLLKHVEAYRRPSPTLINDENQHAPDCEFITHQE